MNEKAAEDMNNFRTFEAWLLFTQCGLVSIIGNGQLCAFVSENEAEETEVRRCINGY